MSYRSTTTAVAAGLVLLVAPLTSAHALTIVNKDTKEHSVGIDMGDKEVVNKIPAGGSITLKDECKDACGVTGPWHYSVTLKTGEKFEFDGKPLVTVAK